MSFKTANNGKEQATSKLTINPFKKSPKLLLPILRSRHPYNCFMYNQAVKHEEFKNDLDFYVIGNQEIDENVWIVSRHLRQDYGYHLCISAPLSIATGDLEIPDDIIQCFTNGGGVIDWKSKIIFVALTQPISRMIFEISANKKLNLTEAHPCYLYYMNIEDALNLDINFKCEDNVELKRLDVNKNDDEFIMSTWKYAIPESRVDIPKCLVGNASAGIFVYGKCVSGVYAPGHGLLSALYTLKEHRGKGYARLTMKYAFKEMAKDGGIPCCTVECRNETSLNFYSKLDPALKVACVVNWIDVKRFVID